MNKLNKKELHEIEGGSSITGTIISAFTNTLKTVYEFGRSLGNAFRRIKEDKMCVVQ
jgi:hypothetical protein